LLTVLLDRHSQIAMLPETHLLRVVAGDRRGGQPAGSHEHLLLAEWNRSWYRLRDLELDPLTVLERLRQHACTPEHLLLTLLELWAERSGKPVGGEKTPQHMEAVDRILTAIPRAKVTMILRDGRAVVESHRHAAWANAGQKDCVAAWIHYAELAERWLAEFPDRVRLVRFEELVADPERILSSLMAWYGQAFEQTQLEAGHSPTFRRWEDHWKHETEGPIDFARGGAWRHAERQLTPEQLARLAPTLARFGYPESTGVASIPIPSPSSGPPTKASRRFPPLSAKPVLIIGAQRAATRSLAEWLATDAGVAQAPDNILNPLANRWPLDRAGFMDALAQKTGEESVDPRIVLDRSPYYLLHPDVARRAHRAVPDAQIVVVLRDPVTRAFSHWLNEWRMGAEALPFGEALGAESTRLGNAEQRLAADETAVSFAHAHYAYALGGRYHQQLAPWYSHFPAGQMMVLVYEELVADPAEAWKELRTFLGLEPLPAPELPREESLRWPVSCHKLLRTPEARSLRSSLASDVAAIEEMLGREMGWPNDGR
ncbi:MAG: sulfotransferase, partial [Gemmatimonadota bacterium]